MPEYPKLVLGCDPGAGGGVAFIGDDFIVAEGMPDTRAEFVDLLEHYRPVRALVERVSSSPQMGVVSAFTFGQNYERIIMGLTCLKIPFAEVLPSKWQKEFLLKKGRGLGLSPTEKKNDHKRVAKELYPTIRVTLKTCDAILIAHCAYRGTL